MFVLRVLEWDNWNIAGRVKPDSYILVLQVTCCMGGWKVMRGVKLCGAPCCPGYEERALNMPLLNTPTVCHKLTQEELRRRDEARMTTPSPTTQFDLLQDEVRLPPDR